MVAVVHAGLCMGGQRITRGSPFLHSVDPGHLTHSGCQTPWQMLLLVEPSCQSLSVGDRVLLCSFRWPETDLDLVTILLTLPHRY